MYVEKVHRFTWNLSRTTEWNWASRLDLLLPATAIHTSLSDLEKFPFFPKYFASTALHLNPSLSKASLTVVSSSLCMTTVFSPEAGWALAPQIHWHDGHVGCHRQVATQQPAKLSGSWPKLVAENQWSLSCSAESSLLATQVWPPTTSLEGCERLL